MSFLSQFAKKEIVGMDLGEASVKFVFLKKGENGDIQLKRKLCYRHPILPETKKWEAFKIFLRQEKLEHIAMATNVEHSSLRIRKVDLPKMDAKDLKDALAWKIREFLEGSVEGHVIRYSPLEEYAAGEAKKVSLIAFAIQRKVVEDRVEFLKKMGLKPLVVEPTAVSTTAALQFVACPDEGKLCALLDLGYAKTRLIVVNRNKLLFSRPFPNFSLSDIFRLCKIESPTEAPEQNKILLYEVYTQIAVEIQRSLDNFSLLFGNHQIQNLYLCGGGAVLPEFTQHLTNSLGLKTEVINPLKHWQLPPDQGHLYMAALGLALYAYG